MYRAPSYFYLSLLILSVINLGFSTSVQAEEPVCIAVYPCLESGELNPIFDLPGFCGDKFRAQCAAVKSSLMGDDLVACQKQGDIDKARISSLEKQLSKLRKKLARSSK